MIITSMLSALLWWYVSSGNRLIDPSLNNHQRRREMMGPLFAIGVFLLSIGFAFISSDLAKASWLLIIITQRFNS
jgi:hypothetical protein